MDTSKKESKAKEKVHEVVTAKNSATEAPATPALCVMQMAPNNYPDWEKKNTAYFSHVYGMFGQFFETKKRYRPPAATRPTVRPPRAGPPTDASSSTTGVQTRRAAQTAPVNTTPGDQDTDISSDCDHDSDSDGSDYEDDL